MTFSENIERRHFLTFFGKSFLLKSLSTLLTILVL